MSENREVSQRDLRSRSKEIMDAVSGGTTFTVTRDGVPIGRLAPLDRKPQAVPVDQFLAAYAGGSAIDTYDAFRADIDAASSAFADYDPFDPIAPRIGQRDEP